MKVKKIVLNLITAKIIFAILTHWLSGSWSEKKLLCLILKKDYILSGKLPEINIIF